MIILFRESGSEIVTRIIDKANVNSLTVDLIELPEASYREFIRENQESLKIERESINIGAFPNKVLFQNIHVRLNQRISIPEITYDNYLTERLQPIREKLEVRTTEDLETILHPIIKEIIGSGKNVETIYANPDEYMLLRQAKYFSIQYEYLKLQGFNWEPKAGDLYHPALEGKKLSVQIV